MDDPNVFAVLIPCDNKNRARTAFRLPENVNRFYKATGGIAEEPTIEIGRASCRERVLAIV